MADVAHTFTALYVDASWLVTLTQTVAWQAQALHAAHTRGQHNLVPSPPIVCHCGTWCWATPAGRAAPPFAAPGPSAAAAAWSPCPTGPSPVAAAAGTKGDSPGDGLALAGEDVEARAAVSSDRLGLAESPLPRRWATAATAPIATFNRFEVLQDCSLTEETTSLAPPGREDVEPGARAVCVAARRGAPVTDARTHGGRALLGAVPGAGGHRTSSSPGSRSRAPSHGAAGGAAAPSSGAGSGAPALFPAGAPFISPRVGQGQDSDIAPSSGVGLAASASLAGAAFISPRVGQEACGQPSSGVGLAAPFAGGDGAPFHQPQGWQAPRQQRRGGGKRAPRKLLFTRCAAALHQRLPRCLEVRS